VESDVQSPKFLCMMDQMDCAALEPPTPENRAHRELSRELMLGSPRESPTVNLIKSRGMHSQVSHFTQHAVVETLPERSSQSSATSLPVPVRKVPTWRDRFRINRNSRDSETKQNQDRKSNIQNKFKKAETLYSVSRRQNPVMEKWTRTKDTVLQFMSKRRLRCERVNDLVTSYPFNLVSFMVILLNAAFIGYEVLGCEKHLDAICRVFGVSTSSPYVDTRQKRDSPQVHFSPQSSESIEVASADDVISF